MKWILRGVVAAVFAGLVAFAGYETYLLGLVADELSLA